AMQVPVIASDVSGIRDLVRHEQNGLLVPSGDSAALAKAILRLLEDTELASRFGAAGLGTVVPAYSIESMIASLEALYDALLKEKQGIGMQRSSHPAQ